MSQNKLPNACKLVMPVAALLCLASYSLNAHAEGDKPDSESVKRVDPIETREEMERRAGKAFGALHDYLRKGNFKAAFPLVLVLAEKGYPQYQVYLGKMYMKGQGTKKDSKAATQWITAAAKGGSREAQALLGRMYFEGNGVPQDFKAARTWLDLSHDDAESSFLLGRIYADGMDVEKDYSRAIDAFKRADALGKDCKNVIGILYSLGGFGVEKNFSQAKKWFELAGTQKNAFACCALGFVYYEGGHGIDKDVDKAKQCITRAKPLLEKAAAAGNPNAQTWLGRINYIGMFQEKDYNKARKYFESSGDPDSLQMMGIMQKKGQGGLTKDFKKAMDYFKRADQLGAFQAKACIGELYYWGQGVKKDFCEAKRWFEKAQKNDDPMAEYYLGLMFANGQCAKQDLRQARLFLQQSAVGMENLVPINDEAPGYLRNANKVLAGLPADPSVVETVQTSAGGESASTQSSITETKVDNASRSPQEPPRDSKKVIADIESLVREFYPRAKIVKNDKSVHFEYKVKKLFLPSSVKQIQVPDTEGIVGDISVVAGKYAGPESLQQTNETYYVNLVMAPYSVPGDSHVLTHLRFPPSTTAEFVHRFKQVVNSFQ